MSIRNLLAVISIAFVLSACAKSNDATKVDTVNSTETSAAMNAVAESEKSLKATGCTVTKTFLEHNEHSDRYEISISCADATDTREGLQNAETALENYLAALNAALGKSPSENDRRELEAKRDITTRMTERMRARIRDRNHLTGIDLDLSNVSSYSDIEL